MNIIFITVVVITCFCLLCVFALAFWGNGAIEAEKIPVMQQNLYSMASFGWQAGFGAILGLIGGQVTAEES
ncbi:hypothetical protein [Gallaecimonas mangrovi]|uniref:hypothetical protein n=1 Tax=Gallaecimonas mangrovi TaxID=2291597 RepID=UPI0012601567|nr:hypothetical protein [Gallaecimonas mangrovi]